MPTSAQHARSIFRHTTGTVINRPTTVSAMTVVSVDDDVLVVLRDGGATGTILWALESDNAASCSSITFDPPIKFFTNVYAEVLTGGSNAYNGLYLAVIEP